MDKITKLWLFIIVFIMAIGLSFLFNVVQYKSNKKLIRKAKTNSEIIEYLEESLYGCNDISEKRIVQIHELQLKLLPYQSSIVKATVYNATKSQCNSDYLHTASMFKLDSIDQYKHKVVAVSRDLLKLYPFGTKIKVSGTKIYDGIWTVQDVMNMRYTNRIDLLINKDMMLIPETKSKICITK